MRVDFWATRRDLVDTLTVIEQQIDSVSYIELGQKTSDRFVVASNFGQIEDLGVSSEKSAVAGQAWEIVQGLARFGQITQPVSGAASVFVSEFPHTSGSVYFKPSYHYRDDHGLLLPGVLADSGTAESKFLFKHLRRIFSARFRREKMGYFGKDAVDQYFQGRLTLIAMGVLERPEQHIRLNNNEPMSQL